MSLDLTVTDLFCGAGGSSIGAEATGARLRMAANHWELAIESHSANFPNADHDCADVSQVDPRRYPRTDVLLASPECTHHSQARSKKHQTDLFNPAGNPAAERSRATMWDVPRFAERHRYEVVIVENVVEVSRWEPFDAWVEAMHSLGYRHKTVCLNSMVAHPTPQSRDRLYVVFWRDGNRAPELDFRPAAWCPTCEFEVEAVQSWKRRTIGKYRQQYLYRCPRCGEVAWPFAWPAASAIDWTLDCPRIGDRKRPLAEATLRRIKVGLERFGYTIVQKSGHTFERPGYARAWPVTKPMPTQTTEIHHALVVPVHHGANGPEARTVAVPWPTQTGRQENALVIPMRTNGRARSADGEPLATITTGHGGAQTLVVPLRRNGRAEPADETPLPAVTAGGNHHGVLVVKNYGKGDDPSMAHSPHEPLGTVTAIDHHSLVRLPFLTSYYRTGGPTPIEHPAPTVTTHDRHALIDPPALEVDVDDCGFRMLEPHEIGRAMAFPDTYEVIGNKRDRVRQYGNAVTPPVMSMLLERAIGSLVEGAA